MKIENEDHYRQALEEIIDLIEKESTSPRLEELVVAVEEYEDVHYPIPPPDPVDLIVFRMDQLNIYPWANCISCGLPLTEEVLDHAEEEFIEPHKDLCCDCFDETFMWDYSDDEKKVHRLIPREVCKDHSILLEWVMNQLKSEDNEARRNTLSGIEALLKKRMLIDKC